MNASHTARAPHVVGITAGVVVLGLAIVVTAQTGCAAEPADDALEELTQPVIHGNLTPVGKHPAVGALRFPTGGGQFSVACTGVLVTPDVVLTAAHCIHPGLGSPERAYFTLLHDAADTTEIAGSDMVAGTLKVSHPDLRLGELNNFMTPGHANDIGLVRLGRRISGVTPARLASVDEARQLAVGLPVEIVGYGETEPNVLATKGVKYDATTTITQVGEFEIYVGEAGSPQFCFGDSGGPAFAPLGPEGELRVVGLASRGASTCAAGVLATRVDGYHDWINDTLAATCERGGSCNLDGDMYDAGCGCRVGGRRDGPWRGSAWLALGVGALLLGRGRRYRRRRM